MTKTTRLTDLQLVLLAGAAGRENSSLIPLPENCAQDTTRIGKAVTSLLRRGLVEEAPVTDPSLVWRDQDEQPIGLFITQAGRDAIGAGVNGRTGDAKSSESSPIPPTSKIARVLSLLQRDEGATLDEMVAATGWLPHTTRAALTGLKKKGHAITKGKRGEVTCYHVAAEA